MNITNINDLIQQINEGMGLDDEMLDIAAASVRIHHPAKRFEDITGTDMRGLRRKVWKDLVTAGLATGPWRE